MSEQQAPAGRQSARAVGREAELAAIERLLADSQKRFSALLLEGEAGIGKTTVFREALKTAAANDFHVLACRPGASEATMALAAIGDLLEDVPADLWVRSREWTRGRFEFGALWA
jgi:primosomal protein N'